MSPVATLMTDDLPVTSSSKQASSDRVLVVGTLELGPEYQARIGQLEHETGSQVDKYLVDRIVDGATTLPASTFTSVHLILPESFYISSLPPTLATQLASALRPDASLTLHHLPSPAPPALLDALASLGITPSPTSPSSFIKTSSPAPAPAAPAAGAARLLRRPGTARSAKSAIWALSAATPSSAGGTLDPASVLTEEDKRAPVCELPTGDKGVKRKRACKGCTCGLADLEAEEDDEKAQAPTPVVFSLDSDVPDELLANGTFGVERTILPDDERARLKAAAAAAPKATSSCGNCYLGDAFRCGGCPYRGLPAFEPGQKVELGSFGDDDV